jgi:cytidine deaminase
VAEPSGAPAPAPESLEQLLAAARAARAAAYAPYSDYAVGAAVLGPDGRVWSGCNVENALYGATVCAERVAVWSAVAAGCRALVALAVVTPSGGPPCGLCRQVLWEFAGPELPVLVAPPAGEPARYRLGELFPHPWGARDLVAGR